MKMGTNYYCHRDVCPHCRRPGSVAHIGKSSAGWSFGFRGTDTIRSFSDWVAELSKPGAAIVNEYGDQMLLADFIALVEDRRGGRCHARAFPQDGWVDDQGHSFTGTEFS